MLDSSSQMIIDSSPSQPQSSTKSSSSNYSNNPPFSDALQQAGNKVEPKPSSNNASQQTQTRNNSSNTVKNQQNNAPKQNTAAKNSNESKAANKSGSGDKTEANNTKTAKSDKTSDTKKDKSKNDSTVQDGNATINLSDQAAQAQKSVGLNLLKAVNPDGSAKGNASPDASLQKTQGSDGKGKTNTTLRDMVAKILNEQAGKGKKTVQSGADASSASQVGSDKTAALAKDVISDFKNVFKNSLSKVTKSGDLKNPLSKDKKDNSLSDKKIDEFVSKILDRLHLNKTNLHTLLHTKDNHQISSGQSDTSSQINSKLPLDMTGNAASLTSANSVNQRTNTVNQTTQLALNTNINQPQWGAEFGKRIQFMMNNHIQTAELRLDPPNLGHIHVKIDMSSDQAHISFSSAHQVVRDSIESTMPRLREMMAESGLQLGNTDVASHFQQNTREQTFTSSNSSGSLMPDSEEDIVSGMSNTPLVHYSTNGMIDYFA